jgi:hypothetical protein
MNYFYFWLYFLKKKYLEKIMRKRKVQLFTVFSLYLMSLLCVYNVYNYDRKYLKNNEFQSYQTNTYKGIIKHDFFVTY